MDATLPAPGVWPALFGVGVGFTLLLGFASALLTGHTAGAELFIALVVSVGSSQAWHRWVNVGDGLSAKYIDMPLATEDN